MNQLTITTWIASVLLHSLVLLPMISVAGTGAREVYDEGSGQDAFQIEQGMTIEAVSFGDANERVEVAEVAPMVANPTPVAETKPIEPEFKDVVAALQSPTETMEVREAPPPEITKPQEVATRDQAAQAEMYSEKSSGVAQDGGKATALSAYVGKIHGALQRVKSRSVAGAVGQVTLGFTLDGNGKILDREVIKSSGIATLDKAAVEWLDRADFPPLPGLLGSGQRFNVPLTFKRKSG
jgi:periplasmic protein TonB